MMRISGAIDVGYPLMETGELPSHIGETVTLHGMIYKIREMSGFAFVLLRTGKSLIQCVHSPEFSLFPRSALAENQSVVLTGEVIGEERSKTGFEVRLRALQSLSPTPVEPPVVINGKEVNSSLETLLDFRPLTLRNVRERAIFSLQSGLCRGFRRFFEENRFTEIHTPKIVFQGAEGGSNVFRLDYFGKEAYLAQSPQFYKQMMVGVFERVYEIAPVFRAEHHDTSRHINEYTSVDLEMGFLKGYTELMELETRMLREVFAFLKEEYTGELALLQAKLPIVESIPAIPFAEAKELVSKTYHREITDFKDLEPEEEKRLCELMKNQTGSDFVFVTRYPSSKRPFYAMDSKDDKEVTESFDLLFRGMEITTGGQRIHNYLEQTAKMKRLGLNPENFKGYLTAHQYGLPPHGGMGIGLERLTAKLLGFSNVRYATLFPRDIQRLEP